MDNILSIKNLKKIYHTPKQETLAVKNFSFDLKEGEFVAIVGPSGCGKSTILSILSGLEDSSGGNFIFKNNAKVGYMLQQDALFEWKTILKNCLLGLEINNNLTKENEEYVISLLNNYGLGDFINSYPNNLSGGMRQRVALIRTLALKPDILLLDEPFSALDYQTRITVSDDVYKIIREENKTALMVTHDISEAVSIGDKVVVLSNRPSVVKNVYEIKMDNKGLPSENRKNEKFNTYYNDIWKDLDHYEH